LTWASKCNGSIAQAAGLALAKIATAMASAVRFMDFSFRCDDAHFDWKRL
jgi:hypothetical protein